MMQARRSWTLLAALATFLAAWIALGIPATARVYIDITSPYLKKIPIAVPCLVPEPDSFENRILARKTSGVLSRDLAFHGFFSVLDPAACEGRRDLQRDECHADYVVKGRLIRRGNELLVEFRLMDMASHKMVEGRRYRGRPKDYRVMAHRFCDLVVRAITGEPGVSLSRITFTMEKGHSREVFSAEFDGYGLRQETRDGSITLSPRYSPDGRFLVYTSYRAGRPYLYIKDLKSGRVRRLAGYPGLNIAPAWHPSGKMLAVTLSKDGNPDIYLIDLRGKVKARLTRGPGMNVSPTWSPDGRRLAFVSDRSGGPQIYVLDLDSRHIRRLTYQGDYNTDPQWSPRGDRIAYAGRTDGAYQVFTISPDGGDPVQLTFEGSNENPSWSPDGRQLLFTSTRSGHEKVLYMMFANGQGRRHVLPGAKDVGTPFWGPNSFR